MPMMFALASVAPIHLHLGTHEIGARCADTVLTRAAGTAPGAIDVGRQISGGDPSADAAECIDLLTRTNEEACLQTTRTAGVGVGAGAAGVTEDQRRGGPQRIGVATQRDPRDTTVAGCAVDEEPLDLHLVDETRISAGALDEVVLRHIVGPCRRRDSGDGWRACRYPCIRRQQRHRIRPLRRRQPRIRASTCRRRRTRPHRSRGQIRPRQTRRASRLKHTPQRLASRSWSRSAAAASPGHHALERGVDALGGRCIAEVSVLVGGGCVHSAGKHRDHRCGQCNSFRIHRACSLCVMDEGVPDSQ